MRVAVFGASGFIGRALCEQLAAAGHAVRAVGRRVDALPDGDGITKLRADVAGEGEVARALDGVDSAYYLVHSMAGGRDFVARDRQLAETFARAARSAGLRRIVYLGALGSGDLSPHLASRQEVGDVLRSSGADVVELRAAVILGAGSISFEMLRFLVERLPAMVCPRWVRTSISPIAMRDVLSYLERSLTVEAGIYEIGADEPTSYREMMDVYADARELRRRMIIDVPLLTLNLSSYWVDLVTPVDRRVSHSLIESLAHEVVVRDPRRTLDAFGLKPMSTVDAMRAALDDQITDVSRSLLGTASGHRDGVSVVRTDAPLHPRDADRARADLRLAGGDLRWYGVAVAWWLRLLLGKLIGERSSLHRPADLVPGAEVDWWVVASVDRDHLVLRSAAWRAGEAWLGYGVARDGSSITQVAALRPRGIFGLLYWRMLIPIHRSVFRLMARHRVRRARGAGV